MKIRCLCDNIIYDQREDLPYTAEYIPDQDYEADKGTTIRFLAEMVRSWAAGEWEKFLDTHFSVKYPHDLPIDSIVSDFLTRQEILFRHNMYECDTCGRLWLQTHPDKDEYVSYLPETEERGLLRGRLSR